MQDECSLGQSHPCLLGVFLLSQLQVAVTVNGQDTGRWDVNPSAPWSSFLSLPYHVPLLQPRGGRQALVLAWSEHRRVKNRASAPLSMMTMVAAELWVEMKSVSLCFSPRQILSNTSCESNIIEPVKSISSLFFADTLELLCFLPQLMSAVCFERKSIQPRSPCYSVMCSEWPSPRQPCSRRRWGWICALSVNTKGKSAW